MRLALQGRLVERPPSQSIPRIALRSRRACFCQRSSQATTSRGPSRSHTAEKDKEEQLSVSARRTSWIERGLRTKDDRHGGEANERNSPGAPEIHARSPIAQELGGVEEARSSPSTKWQDSQMVPVAQLNAPSSGAVWRPSLFRPGQDQDQEKTPAWKSRLVTMEQYERESYLLDRKVRGKRLIDDASYAQDWGLWMELLSFRRRHYGAKGTIDLYKEIIRRDLLMPTDGILATQLWDLLIRAGFYYPELLERTIIYAARLKGDAGQSWADLYYLIISLALKKLPDSAYTWHVKLRDEFPPTLKDYLRIFELSLRHGRLSHFSTLYKDMPLIGMYKTVIPLLCTSEMYAEALHWHKLLCETGDIPTQPSDIQPLLDYLIWIGDKVLFEQVIRQLPVAKFAISNVADHSVQRNPMISREIMNEQLGEIHGIAPIRLSDSFCARLFATRMFPVDALIKGLHMMATETIGPLSLREIALRENCDTGAICQHIDSLRATGISLGNSTYCTLIRNWAMENRCEILQSLVYCDLHPDTFADVNLQERLLAQYYDENDPVKIERTLAVLTTGYSESNLQHVRTNLIFRCQITLGMREKVLATLEEMKRMSITVTPRSSRHLRIHWLSRRQVGRRAWRTQELSILVQVKQMAMQSGRPVPTIAWREILRRLGMAGRLIEFETLALWLVSWYSRPVTNAAHRRRVMLSDRHGQAPIQGHTPQRGPQTDYFQRSLGTLFTIAAQQAIVAWGFQHSVPPREPTRKRQQTSTTEVGPSQPGSTSSIHWTWGLHLLHKLKEHGLPVHQGVVARACRQRLYVLFGEGSSVHKINRLSRAKAVSESHSIEMYIEKMKEIWGDDLFRIWLPRGWRRSRKLEDWKMQTLSLHRPLKDESQASTLMLYEVDRRK